MILSVTLNPSLDHALFLKELKLSDTNRVVRTETDAGGKGVNLSRVVAELGGSTQATGFLGGGPAAFIRCVLDVQGVAHCFVDIQGTTRTNLSVEDESDRPPTTFNERGPEIRPAEWKALLAKVRELAPQVRWMALGGSLPPGVPPDAFAVLARIGTESGCRVVLDADGEPMRLGMEARPAFIKPNQKEASRLLDREVSTEAEAVAAARELLGRLDPGPDSFVVISRGADGAVLASRNGAWLGKSPEVDVRSTIGSGDSMIGGILWALESGQELAEAFRYGLAAGAATATTDGSEIARKPKILELLPNSIVTPAS